MTTDPSRRRGPGDRPWVLAPATAIVAVTLASAGLRIEAAVWAVFATAGTLAALRARRGAAWPFWAALGIVAAVSGSRGATGFDAASSAAGVVLAIGLAAATLAGVAIAAGGGTTLETAYRLALELVGLPGTRWTVVKGRLEATGSVAPGGVIVVPDKWLVVTARGSEFARVIAPGAGRVALARDEQPYRAVPLAELHLEGEMAGSMTRDAVPIRRLTWRARCRLRLLPGSSPTPGDRPPFDPYAARQAAWGPDGLAAAAAQEVESALAEAIRGIDMKRHFDPLGDRVPLEEATEVARRDLAAALDAWGLAFLGLRIHHIELDADVQEHLTAIWHMKVERHVRALARAADEADAAPAQGDPPAPSASHSPPHPGASPAPEPETPQAVQVPLPRPGALGAAPTPDDPPMTGAAPDPSRHPDNPVSFSRFLGTLRRRANSGDEAAATVLRQVLEAMSRIEAPTQSAEGDGDSPAAMD